MVLKKFDKYGFYRSIEPQKSFLQTAWKIDNSMEIQDSELLIDVEILNINLVSFIQILEETKGDKKVIAKRILDIVSARGKLHNPVTGTGGMLYGRIKKIGKLYCNNQNLKEGDEIISLVSLSTTPLKIDRIVGIDIGYAQIKVQGQAVVFQSSLIIKKPDDISLRVLISALDEAGAPAETSLIVNENNRVIILGAWGKMGLLCGFAAREKLGSTGHLVGIIPSENGAQKLLDSKIFDEVLCCDMNNALDFYNSYFEGSKTFDVVINCADESYTEMASILLAKNKGTVYFASLTGDCKVASLTAESISKDVHIIPYRGYVEGHAAYTSNLIRKNPKLLELIEYGQDQNAAFLNAFKDDDNEFIENNFANAASQIDGDYVFESKAMKKVMLDALKVSKYNCTVLICGESGTGKEVVAQFIYKNSQRNSFPFIKINCASIPEHLLESELFGYEKGAFTGADPKGKKGLWEMAQGGILFLDEIGELPMSLQSKLLRVLQENEIYRIGGITPIKTDARIIAASNKNMAAMVRAGEFREDLYYRLSVFPIHIPSLRERKEDIGILIRLLARQYNEKFEIEKIIENAAIEYMTKYDWPGNIRELQNVVQRILIKSDSSLVKLKDMRDLNYFEGIEDANELQAKGATLQEMAYLNMSNKTMSEALEEIESSILKQYKAEYKTTRKIASALGLTQSGVARRLIKYGIK